MRKMTILLSGFALLGFLLLASCSPGGSSQNSVNCSAKGEVCIHFDNVQPFSMGEPMVLNIIVSSTKDFSDLYVTLSNDSYLTVDGPQTWENYLTKSQNDPGEAYWSFTIKAGQTLTFKRVLRFPSIEGYTFIQAWVFNYGRSLDATDIMYVLHQQKGVQIFRENTPLAPFTPNATSEVYWLETQNSRKGTAMAITATGVVASQFAPLVATSTPTPPAYPPPPSSSPTRTPTPHSSPYP